MPTCPSCATTIPDDGTTCPRCAPKAGQGCGRVELVVLALICLIFAAVHGPSLLEADPRANERSPIGSLKAVRSMQQLFRDQDKDRDGTLDYGALAELSAAGLIDRILGSGEKQGYLFECRPSPLTPGLLWSAVARPVTPGTTGARYFVTNQAGIIYYSTTAPFTLTPDASIPAGAAELGR